LFPLGRAKLSGVFEKFFVLQNTPSLIWTKGLKCTPISGLFLENFFEKNFTLHLFGIGVSKRNLFQRKNLKKGQKNLPAESGEQGILAFPSLNIGEKTFNST